MKKLSKNKTRLIVFILLSVVSLSLILIFTVNEKTIDTLSTINPLFLLYCLIFWFFVLTLDALGVVFLIRGTGEKIRIADSYKLTVIRVFFNLITPFTFGGQPFMIYVLNKFGIPGGKGSAIVMTRLLCVAAFTLGGGIISLFVFRDMIQSNHFLSYTFLITIILLIGLFLLLILIMLFPPIMKTVLSIIGKIGSKIKIIKDLEGFNTKAVEEIHHMRQSFINYFGKHILSFLLGFLFTSASLFFNVIIIVIIINGFGDFISLKEGISAGILLLFCISYMPTPGSSGLGEGVFVLIFQGFVPIYLIGLIVILWRFFYQYLTAITGALLSARLFSKILIGDK